MNNKINNKIKLNINIANSKFKSKSGLLAITIIFVLGLLNINTVNSYTQQELNSANSLANKGIIVNHYNNPANYNIDSFVLRQEIAAISREVAGIEKSSSCNNVFGDVSNNTPNTWACNSIEPLYYAGNIAKNANFRPEDSITKSEALGLLVKSSCMGEEYNYNSSLRSSWQAQIVGFSVNNNITDNFTDYNSRATRGWIFNSANNIINQCNAREFSSGDIEEIDTFLEYIFAGE